MVNEHYDSVYAAMKERQMRWLENNRPELLKKMSGEDHDYDTDDDCSGLEATRRSTNGEGNLSQD